MLARRKSERIHKFDVEPMIDFFLDLNKGLSFGRNRDERNCGTKTLEAIVILRI